MHFRRGTDNATVRPIAWAFEDFHEWVLSLPWVVERLNDDVVPAVRRFAVDCEPLGRRQTLLLTGLEQLRESDGPSIAVVVPAEAAGQVANIGRGQPIAPMPPRHELVAFSGRFHDRRAELEALVLTAYGYAMS
jgi:hypothetical protein